MYKLLKTENINNKVKNKGYHNSTIRYNCSLNSNYFQFYLLLYLYFTKNVNNFNLRTSLITCDSKFFMKIIKAHRETLKKNETINWFDIEIQNLF